MLYMFVRPSVRPSVRSFARSMIRRFFFFFFFAAACTQGPTSTGEEEEKELKERFKSRSWVHVVRMYESLSLACVCLSVRLSVCPFVCGAELLCLTRMTHSALACSLARLLAHLLLSPNHYFVQVDRKGGEGGS